MLESPLKLMLPISWGLWKTSLVNFYVMTKVAPHNIEILFAVFLSFFFVYETCLQEPVSKMQRKTLSSSKSSGSKIQTGTGNHQLQKKNSASGLVEKQVNETRLKAEQEAKEKARRETEKIVEEKNKVRELKVTCLLFIISMIVVGLVLHGS